MGRVVVFGSLNVDLVTSVERHPRPGETVLGSGLARLAGGKGANQAVAAAGAGARVVMIGCVGDDAEGAAYVRRLAGLGVDVSSVRVAAGAPTGTALVAVSDSGENTIVVVPGANACVGAAEVAALRRLGLGPGDVLLVQLEVPLASVCRAVRLAAGAGARVVLNAAPYAALPGDVVALCDPLVANESEALLVADAGVVPGSLLVTLGAHGAVWDGVSYPAVAVAPAEVVDTTGAGDAFCGALAAALASGVAREAAVAGAALAGADAVRRSGAQPAPELAV